VHPGVLFPFNAASAGADFPQSAERKQDSATDRGNGLGALGAPVPMRLKRGGRS